ncbi:MAG: 4-hydroxybutyrate CoA-transferase [Proteobacteria bacterium]|nr:MAG: 4-hydroxybutyrate CoA-transferase [Pseudomonadota bacterium]
MRTLTPAEAAALVRDVDTLAVPLGPGQPPAFLHALSARDDFRDLAVFAALLVDLFPLFTRRGVRLLSGFFGPVERVLRAKGHAVEFVPADFRRFATLARRMAPRVMATAVAPPDADGWMSLALHAGATVDELKRCGRDPHRLLVVEANAGLPRTLGLPPAHPHALHVDEVDVLIEGDRPVRTLPETPADEAERKIAAFARSYIRDGCTLQTGIGGVPDLIARMLAEEPGGDYGVHSEMFTDGLMQLHRAGKVRNAKGVHDGYSVCTFAMGSSALYEWLDGNEQVRFIPVDEVNDPIRIARNRQMISINGALSVDLVGQVVADRIGDRQHSGIGGHEDFVTGAAMSEGGHSLICLPATAKTPQGVVSRIVTRFTAGSTVTTPRHQVDVVITEYGAAELAGKSERERAEALVAIAHPAARKALADGETPGPIADAE